jgi:hypothetical protein
MKYGKNLQSIMSAWDYAKENPGKKVAYVTSDGFMVLTFNKSEGYGGQEIIEIEIDGEKQCPQK